MAFRPVRESVPNRGAITEAGEPRIVNGAILSGDDIPFGCVNGAMAPL